MYFLFDGDYLAHRAVYMNDGNGGTTADLIDTAQGLMMTWMKRAAKAMNGIKDQTPILCMSKFRTPNFRHELFSGYKASRKLREIPDQLPAIYEAIEDGLIADEVRCQEGLEADDLMGIYATLPKLTACIITCDKDLKQIPGPRYDPMHDTYEFVTAPESQRYFYRQWLSGDSTDCIPGLPGVGPKKADKILDEAEEGYERAVLRAYKEHKLKYKYCILQGRLVKILTSQECKVNKDGSITVKMWSPKDTFKWK